MEYARNAVQFFTAVCNDWQKLLAEDDYKQLVIDALKFRVSRGEVKVGAFVPIAIGMPNHIHLIWRIQNGFELETVQRDFLKFTAKALVEKIKAEKGEATLELLYAGLKAGSIRFGNVIR